MKLYILIYQKDEFDYEILGVYDASHIALAEEKFRSQGKRWGLTIEEATLNHFPSSKSK